MMLKIIIITIPIALVTFGAFMMAENANEREHRLDQSDFAQDGHESYEVTNCVPKDSDVVISRNIANKTHSFDLKTCEWKEKK